MIRSNKFILIFLFILVGLIIVGVYYQKHKTKPMVSSSISDQLSFPAILPPRQVQTYSVDASSIKYYKQDQTNQIFSFVMQSNNNKITFTEQAYPEILIFDKLTGAMNEYDSIGTSAGQVVLTKPKNLHGIQTAVMKTDQLLLFAYPEKNLSNDQWRQIFNSMTPVK